jgi:hypothetical protein
MQALRSSPLILAGRSWKLDAESLEGLTLREALTSGIAGKREEPLALRLEALGLRLLGVCAHRIDERS